MIPTLSRWCRRALAATLSATLILLSPGLGGYSALAASNSSGPRSGSPVGPVALPAASVPSAELPSLPAVPALAAPALTGAPESASAAAAPAPSAPGLAPEAASVPSPSALHAADAAAAAALPSAEAPARPAAPAAPAASGNAARIAGEVSRLIESAGALDHAEPGDARELGGRVEAALTGEDAGFSDAWDLSAPAPARMGTPVSGGVYLAKPAGQSISQAAQAFSSGAPAAPVPPRASGTDSGDGSGAGRGPLWPRLFSLALGLVPGALLGVPLLAGGSFIGGSVVILASLGVAALPFMSSSWPKSLRSLPGLALGVLGLGTVGLSFFPVSAAGIALGSMVALGGWGLTRFARNPGKFNKWDSGEILATFFGAFGSVAGAGLLLLHPAGWAFAALSYAAFVAPIPLFMHLPGWVGASIKAGVQAVIYSVGDAVKTATSVSRDTLLHDRLRAFTEASFKQSAWNGLWLGLVVWLPVLTVEAAKFLAGLIAGVAVAAARLVPMLLWGAAHELKADTAATKFFAGWARRQFAQSKGTVFNRIEARLIPWADSPSRLKSWPAALAISLLQAGWLAYLIVHSPFALVLGLRDGFKARGEAYDAERHDPDRFDLPSERQGLPPRSSEDPDKDPKGPIGPVAAKLIAAGAALLPVYFLALPVLLESSLIVAGLFAASGAAAAAMPLLPANRRFPMFLRKLPGYLLTAAGLAALLFVPWAGGLAADLNAVAAELVAALAGLGLVNYAEKLAKKDETDRYPVDDPAYIGGFVGVVGTLAALGLGVVGIAGPVGTVIAVAGYLSSILLLAHLPGWLWKGVATTIEGFAYSVIKAYGVMHFWKDDTKLSRNLRDWTRSWIGKSVWNGAWLWPVMLLLPLNTLIDAVLSLAVGLAYGLVKAPLLWAWGAAYDKNPTSKLSRFLAGFARSALEDGIGSKAAVFDKWARGLIPALDAATASGRPPLKTALAFLAARFVQLAWLLRLVVWSPVILWRAFKAGKANTAGEKTMPEETWKDQDRPGHTL